VDGGDVGSRLVCGAEAKLDHLSVYGGREDELPDAHVELRYVHFDEGVSESMGVDGVIRALPREHMAA